jgi:hypothetical protein
MRFLKLGILVAVALSHTLLLANNVCTTRSRARGGIRGACGDRTLPADRTRNLHSNSIRLECSSEVDHYVRTPDPFVMNTKSVQEVVDEWLWAEEEDNPYKMQAWLHEHNKIPRWKGVIPYDTIEKWAWEDCVFGLDSSCPIEVKTRTVTRTDSEGKTYTETETYTEQPPCWHDETRYESRHCSSERMTFDSEFIRPSTDPNTAAKDSDAGHPGHANYWWNPSHPDYYDVLPSKYDLLPGEVEDVQIYSNASMSTRIEPTTKVGDAWNDYRFKHEIVGQGSSTSCEMRAPYNLPPLHLKVDIFTEKRKMGKKSPNALRAGGRDSEGNATDPLAFNQEADRAGNLMRTEPYELRLVDTSAFIVEAMARQSRKDTAAREAAKLEAGEGSNSTFEERKKVAELNQKLEEARQQKKSKKKSFYKETRVRVKLWEVTGFASRNIRLDKLYRTSAEIARADHYMVPLDEGADTLYKLGGIPHHLKPGYKYRLTVAMYNHGVPFYRQEGTGIDALESWYSDEIPLDFATPKAMKDERGVFERIVDHYNGSSAEKASNWWSVFTFKWMRD